MSQKIYLAIFSTMALMVALSCGGSTNNGVVTTELTGQIDLKSSFFKTRFASSDPLSGFAWNVDTPLQKEIIRVSSSLEYRATVVRGEDIIVEITRGGSVILSRAFSEEQTSVSELRAKINLVTHIQAKLALENNRQRKSDSFSGSIKLANKTLFAKEDPDEATEMRLSVIGGLHPEFAAVLSVFGKLVEAESSTFVDLAVTRVGALFDVIVPLEVKSSYIDLVNASSGPLTTAIAAAHESAKNASLVSVTFFDAILSEISSVDFISGIDLAKTPPVFRSPVDELTVAAPGVLFTYTFPGAIGDILGIHHYSASWGSEPLGPYDSESNFSKTLKWIPSKGDVGTHTYTVEAFGVNGKSATQSVSVVVKDLDLVGLERKKLDSSSGYYRPTLGPALGGDYVYLVSAYTDSLKYRLEKYSLADVEDSGIDSAITAETWNLPSGAGAVYDLSIFGNNAYIATQFSGVLAYDRSFSGVMPTTPTYQASGMSVDSLVQVGDHIYGLNSNSFTVIQTTESLSTTQTLSGISSRASEISAQDLGVLGGDYLYIAGQNTMSIYLQSSSGALGLLSTTLGDSGPSSARAVERANGGVGVESYLVSQNSSSIFRITSTGSETSTLASGFSDAEKAVANGTYAYVAQSNTSSVQARSLRGETHRVSERPENTDYPLYYNNADLLRPMLRNIPGGVELKRGSYLYTVGQNTSTTVGDPDSWHIKVIRLAPQSE